MKRPDPVLHHLIAAMLYAWSLVGVNIAWHSTALAAWLTATVVCYLAAIALFQALQASWRAWREHKAPTAAKAPLWPTSTADQVFEAYDAERAEQQHAEAIAAVAAKPMQSQRIGDTAVMPVVVTGVTWGFGPTGVVDAPPEPWTVPDEATFDAFVRERSAARRARHAVPEGLPAALQEFDYEPAAVAR